MSGRLRGFTATVIVLSDRASSGSYEDKSGPVLERLLVDEGAEVVERLLLPDGLDPLAGTLRRIAGTGGVDFVATSGGTGFSPRDVTPEATRSVVERLTPGIDELIRAEGRAFTKLAAASRAVSGIRGQTFICNLSGSPGAVEEQFGILMEVLPHVLHILTGKPKP